MLIPEIMLQQFGLFLNEDDGEPTYLLGNTGGTDNNWYVFGDIAITNE